MKTWLKTGTVPPFTDVVMEYYLSLKAIGSLPKIAELESRIKKVVEEFEADLEAEKEVSGSSGKWSYD
jgi:hypothetical protein